MLEAAGERPGNRWTRCSAEPRSICPRLERGRQSSESLPDVAVTVLAVSVFGVLLRRPRGAAKA